MNRTTRTLQVAALLESASLAFLLVNIIALDNSPQIAATVGPIHGCLYVFVIIAAARHPHGAPKITARAVIPAVGGLLALRALTTRSQTLSISTSPVPPRGRTVGGEAGDSGAEGSDAGRIPLHPRVANRRCRRRTEHPDRIMLSRSLRIVARRHIRSRRRTKSVRVTGRHFA
jgi:hypothetical protein